METNKSGLASLTSDIPILSKLFLGVLVLLFLIGKIIPYSEELLALIPPLTFPPYFYLWNIITCGYFEISIISLLSDIFAMLTLGKMLENKWGSREFFKFIGFVNAVVGVCVFLSYALYYSLIGDVDNWFEVKVSGFSGVCSGFLVAWTQINPDKEYNLPFGILRVKIIPAIVGLTNIIFLVIGVPTLLSLYGLIASWTYLRFYQLHPNSDLKGDQSDSFSFASFFPLAMQGSVSILSNTIYNILTILRLCKKQDRSNIIPSASEEASSIPQPQAPADVSAESERRRQRALKALEQRMNQMTPGANLSQTNSEQLEQSVV